MAALIVIAVLVAAWWTLRLCWHHSGEWKACQTAWSAVARFRREVDQVYEYPARARRDLATEASAYAAAQRAAARAAVALENLRDYGAKNVRWTSLLAAGVRTLEDVLAASGAGLRSIEGVGETTAERVTAAARAAVAAIDARPIDLPGTSFLRPRSLELVTSAARSSEANSLLGDLRTQLASEAKDLGVAENALRRKATFWRWIRSESYVAKGESTLAEAQALQTRAMSALEGERLREARGRIQGIEDRWKCGAGADATLADRARVVYPKLLEDLCTFVGGTSGVRGVRAVQAEVSRAPPRAPTPVPTPAAEEPVSYRVLERGRTWEPTPASPRPSAVREAVMPPGARPARWIPAGEAAEVQGYRVPGGLIYVGDYVIDGSRPPRDDPALIHPALAVNRRAPDRSGAGMGYWPWYARLSPESRAAYLEWLAGGRRDPAANIGYVFLFFYGLERRLLTDALEDPAARADTAVIVAEVERLLSIYASNASFGGYATAFLDLLRARDAGSQDLCDSAPPAMVRGAETPLALKVALGQFVARGKAIDAAWALAWVTHDPNTSLRTPAARCPDEFRELFLLRYGAQFGEGLRLTRNRTPLVLRYQPASAGFSDPVAVPIGDLPDVTALSVPLQRLRDLAQACTDALEPYSRLVGRSPTDRESPRGVALLPPEIASRASGGQVRALCTWVEATLGSSTMASSAAGELIDMWSESPHGRFDRGDATALAQFLEHRGYGMEPDVRFGGEPIVRGGRAIFYRQTGAPIGTASADYATAATLLRLGTIVAGTDGALGDAERAHMERKVEASLDLTPSERLRLKAHLRWLLEAKVGLGGLKRRLERLPEEARAQLGAFAVSVAAADGRVDAGEVKTLLRLFGLLSLNPDDVYTDLHRLGAGAIPGEPGPRAARGEGARTTPSPAGDPSASPGPSGVVRLDPAVVRAKLAESEAVLNVLKTVFEQDEPASRPASPTSPAPTSHPESRIWNLDAAHSTFLRELLGRSTWPRGDYEALAARHRLMPEGALERINDASYEAVDEPILEGEDPIEPRPELLEKQLV